MPIQTQNPYTEKVEKVFTPITPEQAVKACVRADKAFQAWRDVPVKKRALLVKNLAKLLRQNKAVYAKTLSREMGKPITQAISEIEKCAWNCEYIAQHGVAFLADELVETEMTKSAIQFEPLGVILAIMPWNFPFWQVFRFASLALLAGDTCLLKHSSNVPQSALLIEKIIRDAGFPKDTFQTVLVESKHIETIIAHDAIKMVILTGSEKAGSEVGALAGKHIKKSVLELGGADPFIVMPDANMADDVAVAVQSRMGNNGQACNAAKRFFVHEKIQKQFVQMAADKLATTVIGDPLDMNTTLGPLVHGGAQEEVFLQVRDSIAAGAQCVLGGNKIERKGFFFEPTILTHVRPGMPAFDDELFGPVFSVMTWKDEEELVRLCNMHRYGLSATIFSKNIKKAEKLASRLDAGLVAINGLAKSDPRLPFGGTKKSGYGREMGKYGIREFTNIKTLMVK